MCDDRLLAVEALLDVKRRVAPYIDLQLVAFPQDGLLRSKTAFDNLKRAIRMGVDVVGGIPHFERTMADGAESVRLLCEFAAEQGLMVDMHCDESDDPLSRHIETLAAETLRLGGPIDNEPWLGSRPATPDGMPVIGPAPRHKNLIFAFGHGHIGLSTGPITGEIVADLATGRTPAVPIAPFAPQRLLGLPRLL